MKQNKFTILYRISVFIITVFSFVSIVSCKQETAELEQNKKNVVEFYNMVFVDHQPENAVKQYVGEKYIQHNPFVPNGTEAFLNYFVPYFQKNPNATAIIKRVVAEGDLVVLHVHSKENESDRGVAVVDVFRVENGKIVEHWDVVQEIPETTANSNTMF